MAAPYRRARRATWRRDPARCALLAAVGNPYLFCCSLSRLPGLGG
uniref:NAD kinase 1 n=1 Tax=Arundo donax TaxID=35708 RepID=A0A0A9GAS9_ARUDO